MTRYAERLVPFLELFRRETSDLYDTYDEYMEARKSVIKRHFKDPQTIGEDDLQEMCSRIICVISDESTGEIWELERVHPRNQSCIWNSQDRVRVHDDLEPLDDILTVHSCGSRVFFKPSFAEVVAQIPAELKDEVVAFEVLDAANLPNSFMGHYARTRLYTRG